MCVNQRGKDSFIFLPFQRQKTKSPAAAVGADDTQSGIDRNTGRLEESSIKVTEARSISPLDERLFAVDRGSSQFTKRSPSRVSPSLSVTVRHLSSPPSLHSLHSTLNRLWGNRKQRLVDPKAEEPGRSASFVELPCLLHIPVPI